MICPSNPVASVDPILAVPGIRDAVAARRDRVVAISPIVRGAPLRGMADKLLPVVGVEVSAVGVAEHYRGLIRGFVIDQRDRDLSEAAASHCERVRVTDTIMVDDRAAEALARVAIETAR
jgi:LPPG:FO 2-phospho-L-lactate transferase